MAVFSAFVSSVVKSCAAFLGTRPSAANRVLIFLLKRTVPEATTHTAMADGGDKESDFVYRIPRKPKKEKIPRNLTEAEIEEREAQSRRNDANDRVVDVHSYARRDPDEQILLDEFIVPDLPGARHPEPFNRRIGLHHRRHLQKRAQELERLHDLHGEVESLYAANKGGIKRLREETHQPYLQSVPKEVTRSLKAAPTTSLLLEDAPGFLPLMDMEAAHAKKLADKKVLLKTSGKAQHKTDTYLKKDQDAVLLAKTTLHHLMPDAEVRRAQQDLSCVHYKAAEKLRAQYIATWGVDLWDERDVDDGHYISPEARARPRYRQAKDAYEKCLADGDAAAGVTTQRITDSALASAVHAVQAASHMPRVPHGYRLENARAPVRREAPPELPKVVLLEDARKGSVYRPVVISDDTSDEDDLEGGALQPIHGLNDYPGLGSITIDLPAGYVCRGSLNENVLLFNIDFEPNGAPANRARYGYGILYAALDPLACKAEIRGNYNEFKRAAPSSRGIMKRAMKAAVEVCHEFCCDDVELLACGDGPKHYVPEEGEEESESVHGVTASAYKRLRSYYKSLGFEPTDATLAPGHAWTLKGHYDESLKPALDSLPSFEAGLEKPEPEPEGGALTRKKVPGYEHIEADVPEDIHITIQKGTFNDIDVFLQIPEPGGKYLSASDMIHVGMKIKALSNTGTILGVYVAAFYNYLSQNDIKYRGLGRTALSIALQIALHLGAVKAWLFASGSGPIHSPTALPPDIKRGTRKELQYRLNQYYFSMGFNPASPDTFLPGLGKNDSDTESGDDMYFCGLTSTVLRHLATGLRSAEGFSYKKDMVHMDVFPKMAHCMVPRVAGSRSKADVMPQPLPLPPPRPKALLHPKHPLARIANPRKPSEVIDLTGSGVSSSSIVGGSETKELSGQQVQQASGGCKVLTYPRLGSIAQWTDLCPSGEGVAVLFCTDSPTDGHWTACFTNAQGAHVFDPLGVALDHERDYISPAMRAQLGEQQPQFGRLLSTFQGPRSVNRIHYQANKPNVNTCGRWTALRLKMRNMSDNDFSNFVKAQMSSAGIQDPDAWVAQYVKA